PTEDETLEHRVRSEPVGAVDTCAGTFAGGVEPGPLRPPVEVGDDSTHGVVRRRSDGDRLLFRTKARLGEAAHQAGKTRPVDRAEIEQGDATYIHRARDYVTGRKLIGEPLPLLVDEQRSGAAQGFAQEQASVGERRRMELDELEVCDCR